MKTIFRKENLKAESVFYIGEQKENQKGKACLQEMVTFNGMNYLQALKGVCAFWSLSK